MGQTHRFHNDFETFSEVDLKKCGSSVYARHPSTEILMQAYATDDGEITEVNEALRDDPALANTDPTGAGWFFKVKFSNAAQLDALLDKTGYDELLKNA